MSQKTTSVCDECGVMAEARAGVFGWNAPAGWLTVSGLGPVISGDLPHEHRAKQPDLCSWKCVASYAAKRAGVQVTA